MEEEELEPWDGYKFPCMSYQVIQEMAKRVSEGNNKIPYLFITLSHFVKEMKELVSSILGHPDNNVNNLVLCDLFLRDAEYDESVEFMRCLSEALKKKTNEIEWLTFESCNLEHVESTNMLFDSFDHPNCKVEYFGLSKTRVSYESLSRFFRMPRSIIPRLKALNISSSDLSLITYELSRWIPPSLKMLVLQQCVIDEKHVKSLIDTVVKSNVVQLNLFGSVIGFEAVSRLFRPDCKLITMDLSHIGLSETEMDECVYKSVYCDKLTYLNIGIDKWDKIDFMFKNKGYIRIIVLMIQAAPFYRNGRKRRFSTFSCVFGRLPIELIRMVKTFLY